MANVLLQNFFSALQNPLEFFSAVPEPQAAFALANGGTRPASAAAVSGLSVLCSTKLTRQHLLNRTSSSEGSKNGTVKNPSSEDLAVFIGSTLLLAGTASYAAYDCGNTIAQSLETGAGCLGIIWGTFALMQVAARFISQQPRG